MNQKHKPPVIVRRGFAFAALVGAGVVLWAFLLPSLNGGGPSKRSRIESNLKRIEIAKQMWASEHGVTGVVQLTDADLAAYLGAAPWDAPIVGERYDINPTGTPPGAELTQDLGPYPSGTIFRLHADGRYAEVILPNQQLERTRRPPAQ